MADKSSFTLEEWNLRVRSVVTAGPAVSMADPSGLWGLLKEGISSAKALAEARIDPGADALVKAVVGDFGTTTAEARPAMTRNRSLPALTPQKSRRRASIPCDKCRHSLMRRRPVMPSPSRNGHVTFWGLRQRNRFGSTRGEYTKPAEACSRGE
jgi:hypothetical protein